jgi:hypothetical protein
MTTRREFLSTITGLATAALLPTGDTLAIPDHPYDHARDGDLLRRLATRRMTRDEFFALTRWVWPSQFSGQVGGLHPEGRWGDGLVGIPEVGIMCRTVEEVKLVLSGAAQGHMPPIDMIKVYANMKWTGFNTFDVNATHFCVSYDTRHDGWPWHDLNIEFAFDTQEKMTDNVSRSVAYLERIATQTRIANKPVAG